MIGHCVESVERGGVYGGHDSKIYKSRYRYISRGIPKYMYIARTHICKVLCVCV